MLTNAYLLAKIGADTAENEQHFAGISPKTGNYLHRRARRVVPTEWSTTSHASADASLPRRSRSRPTGRPGRRQGRLFDPVSGEGCRQARLRTARSWLYRSPFCNEIVLRISIPLNLKALVEIYTIRTLVQTVTCSIKFIIKRNVVFSKSLNVLFWKYAFLQKHACFRVKNAINTPNTAVFPNPETSITITV